MFDELEKKRLNNKLTKFEDYLTELYDGYKFKNELEGENDENKKQFISNE